MRLFGKYRLTTFQIIAFGFIALILMGTLLLFLPFASKKTGSVGFLGGLTLIYAAQLVKKGTQCMQPLEKITVG